MRHALKAFAHTRIGMTLVIIATAWWQAPEWIEAIETFEKWSK